MVDIAALAEELENAYATKTILPVPLSSREAGFDLSSAYAIEAKLTRRRPHACRSQGWLRQQGDVASAHARHAGLGPHARPHGDSGREIGAAVARRVSPKIEPEIDLTLTTTP